MKILMISDVYFPRVNGVSTSIHTFRRELGALGIETRLVAPAYPAPFADEQGVERIPSSRVPLDPEDRRMHARPIRALAASLGQEGFDLVHVQTPFVAHYLGLELARRFGIPAIETYHTFFEEYLFHYVPFLPRAWLRAAARRFSRVQGNSVQALVVPSTPMREVLGGYGVTTPMHVIPTGIPLADFGGGDGARFRARLGIPAATPLLLFVGRVAHEKNIGFLLRALRIALQQVPALEMVIAGEGPAEPSLRRETTALGLGDRVHFVGYLDRKGALPDCYAAADAFVFASRTETQGLVLLEAMAVGLPVISTAVMGTRDIVGPRRGALVPEDDEISFAGEIVRLLRDAPLRESLSREARACAREWQADTQARRLAALYAEVIAAGRPARR
jgi:glycosyltransferase involved in cell wall biosynthesis